MSYLTLAVPAILAQVANAICVAFEPDQSISPLNYNGFSVVCTSASGEQYLAYGADVVDALAAQVAIYKTDANALHSTVSDAYAARWPDIDQPTLTACADFCSSVLLSGEYCLVAGLMDLGLVLTKDDKSI